MTAMTPEQKITEFLADDKKLIEIYIAIVKEMAVKAGIDEK